MPRPGSAPPRVATYLLLLLRRYSGVGFFRGLRRYCFSQSSRAIPAPGVGGRPRALL
jgi:hypothetical protein